MLAEGLPPRESVHAVLTGLIRSTAGHIDEAKVFARDKDRLDDARMRSVRADRRRYHEAFRDLVEQGQRDGVFSTATPAETVTIVALGMVNQMPSWYRPDGPKTAEQLADEVAALSWQPWISAASGDAALCFFLSPPSGLGGPPSSSKAAIAGIAPARLAARCAIGFSRARNRLRTRSQR